VQWCMECAPY